MNNWDVIVIGGGIIGLSLSLELRKKGATVLIVERGQPGREASHAAGGMLVDSATETPSTLQPLATASAHMYPEFVYELQVESGLKVDLRDHGALLAPPFTMLKLDKELVREAAVTPAARLFLGGAVAAAHAAGLVVTAEGVEDEACWARMNTLGVEFAQGFLVGRPLSAEAMLGWHRKWNISYPR